MFHIEQKNQWNSYVFNDLIASTDYIMSIDGLAISIDSRVPSDQRYIQNLSTMQTFTDNRVSSSVDRMTYNQRLHMCSLSDKLVSGGMTVLVSMTIGLIDRDSVNVVCSYLTRVELANYKKRYDIICIHPFELEEPDNVRIISRQKNRKKNATSIKTWLQKIWN